MSDALLDSKRAWTTLRQAEKQVAHHRRRYDDAMNHLAAALEDESRFDPESLVKPHGRWWAWRLRKRSYQFQPELQWARSVGADLRHAEEQLFELIEERITVRELSLRG